MSAERKDGGESVGTDVAPHVGTDVAPHVAGVRRMLVTGATGFIASHVVRVCLEAGLTVRGTVRSLANTARLEHLRSLPGADKRLELVEANLMDATCWATVVKDCTHVMHVASPAPARIPEHEDELVKPAVNGTTNVLRAAHAAGVKRVVVTSSNSAIAQGHPDKVARGEAFTEEDWSDCTKSDMSVAYTKSKTLAEKAAWAFSKESGMEVATICPVLVIGPVLGSYVPGSMVSIAKLLNGSLPLVPDLTWSMVHVDDVAQAHLRAALLPQAAGNRFLLSHKEVTFKQLASYLYPTYRAMGFAVPSWPFPTPVVRALAPVVPVFRLVVNKLGKVVRSDGSKTTRVLGIQYKPIRQAALEGAASLIAKNLVKPTLAKRNAILYGAATVVAILTGYLVL